MVGVYTATVNHSGFATQKIDNVTVEVGKATNIPVTLAVATVTQTVEVSATAASLETQQTALNSVVSTRAVEEIPLNGRDYTQLLQLTTGYNRAGSQNGNRGNENNWQLDGVDNNDLWGGAPTPLTRAASPELPAYLSPSIPLRNSPSRVWAGPISAGTLAPLSMS
jgi:hypothetical protein